MKNTFKKNFFLENRNKLFIELPEKSLVILFSAEQFPKNGDQYYKYRQNSDTFYFTGLNQEETTILLFKDRGAKQFVEYAFIIEPDQKMITWIGHKFSKQEVSDISGINNVEFNDRFNSFFEKLVIEAENVFVSQKSNIRGIRYKNTKVETLTDNLAKHHQHIDIQDLDVFSMKLRLNKTADEISAIQKAIDITGETFLDILKIVQPGIYEYQVEGEMIKGFLSRGAQDYAYSPIIASGNNNNILHYNTNRNQCKDGDLLLLDFGAELDYYAADITRTIPVSGKFTERQKEVYNAVLDVQKRMIEKTVPGTTIRELNKECEMLIQNELLKLKLISRFDIASQDEENPAFKKYYMHGVSHFIGLDVHDTGKKDTILEPGMILSCEPAIYIEEEGFGIRLENDILVADKPVNLSKNIPIEIDEIEALMNSK